MKKIGLLHRLVSNTNIPLLIFLVLLFNVKFVVKLLAILLIVLYYKNFRFGFSWKQSRLPLFYLFIILLEIIKFIFITGNYSFNYMLAFSLGMLQWVMCLLAMHYLKLNVEQDTGLKTHNTIRAFFFINFIASLLFLVLLLFFPASLSYWGHGPDISFTHPSSGDTILGITFDSSIVNATLNSLGLIYFLYKKDYLFSGICLVVLVLCTSNIVFILTMLTLGLMFLTVRSNKLRFRALFTGILLVILYFSISSANREYVRNYFIQVYILNKNPEIITPGIDTTHIITLETDTGTETLALTETKLPDTVYSFSKQKLEKALVNLIATPKNKDGLLTDSTGYISFSEADYKSKPGKLISFFQTWHYLKENLRHFLFGSGIGNFSSKLAFRTSGTNILGTYPRKYIYVAPEFKHNHLKSFLFYFEQDASQHSVLNYPFSVYNQLFGEYGFIGAILFAIFYLGYFISRYRQLTYGRYLIVILLGFFFMEYWLELFSLVILFELMMLLNIKENPLPPGKKVQ